MFATGGLGGVHRGARETFDESADLTALARHADRASCAPGVKSILDVGATLERLETLGVTRRSATAPTRFPGFYLADSRLPVPWRLDTPAEVAAALRARRALGCAARSWSPTRSPPTEQIDPDAARPRARRGAGAAAAAQGVARQGRHAVPARRASTRRPAGEPARRTSRWCCATRALAGEIAAARA